jgi:hypothetical protein
MSIKPQQEKGELETPKPAEEVLNLVGILAEFD